MIKDPFSYATVYTLMGKLFEMGSLHDKPRSGRPCLSHRLLNRSILGVYGLSHDDISSIQEDITASACD